MAYNNGDVDPRAFLQEVGVYACSPIFSDPILKIQAVQKVNTELIMNLTSVSDNQSLATCILRKKHGSLDCYNTLHMICCRTYKKIALRNAFTNPATRSAAAKQIV